MSDENFATVRVPRELKEKMKRVRVNRSQFIREAIQRRIDEQRLREASARLDGIRMRSGPVATDELVS